MATRLKTIRYAWPVALGPTTDAVYQSLGTINLFVPELTRTIRSAYVIVHWQDVITATGGTIAAWRVRMQLGAGTPSEVLSTGAIANTGESLAVGLGPIDFTSYFASDLGAGSSQTCMLEAYCDQSTGTTLGTANVTAELVLTYEYDDSAITQIKTVYIPLECPEAGLDPTTLTEIGSNQIPQLTGVGGFIREASPVIRDYYFVLEGNENANASAVDFTLGVSIDAEPEFAFTTTERALASDRFVNFIWSRTGDYPDPATGHAFKARSAGLAAFRQLCIVLIVTYEFDASATTEATNSILIPFELPSPMGNSAANHSRFSRELLVDEPGPVALLQSAFRLNFQTGAVISALWARSGSQSYKSYVTNANVVCGMLCLQQRIDAGSSQGAAISLARGSNTLNIDFHNTDVTPDHATNLCGLLILNYASAVRPEGIAAHSHTVFSLVRAMSTTLAIYSQVAGMSLGIPESNYWVVGLGFLQRTLSSGPVSTVLAVKVEASEGEGGGWRDLYADTAITDSELGEVQVYSRARDEFRRHPGDPDPRRLSLDVPRTYSVLYSASRAFGVEQLVTYHSMLDVLSGTVTPNPGAGVSIDIHRADTLERLYVATTGASGQFSAQVHHDMLPYFAQGRVSATAFGRSDNVLPGTPANIDFDSTGPGSSGISRSRVQGDQ